MLVLHMRLLRSLWILLRSLWMWIGGIALVLTWVPVLAVVRLTDRKPAYLRSGRCFRRLGRLLAGINPWHIQISGSENVDADQVYVIVSNHQSVADIPVISHLRHDTKWLAKAELFRIPIVGWMLRMAGDISIERSNPRQAAQALLQCAQYLRQRCSVVFFPEGTRSSDGELLAFNDGPFRLAIRERVSILPLVVHGSGQALPKGSPFIGGTEDIFLRILKPISVEGWSAKESSLLRDLVRNSMADELVRLRSMA
jgi:1-acyl-sn-glycerol-3-phosphate acyltransferase